MWRSVCAPACSTDSSSHFCPKNSTCHQQKTLTHQVFCVEKKNLCDGEPAQPRRQWTFPQKTAFLPVSESQTATNLLMVTKKSNFDTFQYVWWVRSSIVTHYNSIHMTIDSQQVHA